MKNEERNHTTLLKRTKARHVGWTQWLMWSLTIQLASGFTAAQASARQAATAEPSDGGIKQAKERLVELQQKNSELEKELREKEEAIQQLGAAEKKRRAELEAAAQVLKDRRDAFEAQIATQESQLAFLVAQIQDEERRAKDLRQIISKNEKLVNEVRQLKEENKAREISVSSHRYQFGQQQQQQQQQQQGSRPDFGPLRPEGEIYGIVRPRNGSKETIHDLCRVEISSGTRDLPLRERGLTGIRFIQEAAGDSKILYRHPVQQEDLVTFGTEDLCAGLEVSGVDSRKFLILILEFSDKTEIRYKFYYRKPAFRFDIGVATYFAGGFDRVQNADRSSFAIFAALKFGFGGNAPLRQDPDFYISGNALIGGGFVVVETERTTADEGAVKGDTQRLSLFPGVSLSLGRYLEVGWAYDVFNRNHMILFSPSSILGATIFQAPRTK